MPLLPVALYGIEVPCGEEITPAARDFPATFRITMAALDPSAPADENAPAGSAPRSTLKMIRQSGGEEDESEDGDDEEYMRALLGEQNSDDEEEESDEEAEGDAGKSKKARKQAALKELLSSIDKDEGSDEEMKDAKDTKSKKGKGKAEESEDEEESEGSDDDSEDDEGMEVEEFVICTLDTEKHWQQPLDITVAEGEHVFFKVSGTHAVHLTGNYLTADDHGHNHHRELHDSDEESDEDDEEDEDYDLSPDEDELDGDESDELDDVENPRVVEVGDEEAPKLVKGDEKKEEKKGKNKRVAEEPSLDEIMEKSATSGGDAKLSKKQQKKLKNNQGEPVASEAEAKDKKVQFAKNLEQGPTGSETKEKAAEKPAEKAGDKQKAQLGVKTVRGVKIDDKKLGTGPAAKKGDRVGMRYIGKLTDGKVFDANKKGKPFSFKLGVGEVITGWDVGVAGMQVGSERRITVPANMAYGNKALPGIPANSTLVFDVKLLEIK